MNRWKFLRWKFVLPRVIALAAIVLAVWLGKDPALRWTFSAAAGRFIGAKVDIASVKTSLGDTHVTLSGVQVADPSSPMTNLVEAASVDLALERDHVLRKRFVVRDGRISGLRFGTPRTTSGELDKLDARFDFGLGRVPKLAGQLQVAAEQWMDTLAGVLERRAEDRLDRFESVQLARELAERWPADLRRVEDRVERIRARIEELQELQRASRDRADLAVNVENGLRAADDIEKLLHDVAQLRKDFAGMGRQLTADRDAMEQAGRHDVAQVRQTLALDRLEGQGLNEFLLGPELSEKLSTLATWVRWVRRYVPHQASPESPSRQRGIDVLFAGLAQQPDFLLRRIALDGAGTIDRKPFTFSGTAEDIASQPAAYGKPAVLKLAVDGAAAMTIEAQLDRTQATPRDTLRIACPAVAQPKRVLGRADRLAVAVSPGAVRMDLDLELEGDRLHGRCTLVQSPVRLTPSFAAGGKYLEAALCEAAAEVREIDVEIAVTGTLDSPVWRVRSPLGGQLADAVRRAAQDELDARAQELAKAVQRRIDAAADVLDRLLAQREEQVLAALDMSRDELDRLKRAIAQSVPAREIAEQTASRLGVRPEAIDRTREALRQQKNRLEKELPVKLPVRF